MIDINKEQALDAKIKVERELGSRSLSAFVRLCWPVIEPNPLRWSWHMGAICEHLEAVSTGQIRQLVICVPPGCSKSLLVSTLWPAYDWIKHPTRRWITATYVQGLSDKNAKLHRDLVLSDYYQARWPVRIGKSSSKKVRLFSNTAGGWRFSTSVGGEVTGRHADIILRDDLLPAQAAQGTAALDAKAIQKANDFHQVTLATRRADAATTADVMIAQRLHYEDPPSKCIAAGYTALILPMEHDIKRICSTGVLWTPPDRVGEALIAPPFGQGKKELFRDPRVEHGELLDPSRFPRAVVEKDREDLGLAFAAQMQQEPIQQTGQLFKGLGDNVYDTLPDRVRKIVTVDCAFKATSASDFVSIQCWAVKAPHYYLVDEIHGRGQVAWTCEKINEILARNPGTIGVYVEDKANGPAVIEMLSQTVAGVQEWSPGKDSKESRAAAVAPLFARNVWIPKKENAPWITAYTTELQKFPLSKHDDRVDAATMALLILHNPMLSKYAAAVAAMRA